MKTIDCTKESKPSIHARMDDLEDKVEYCVIALNEIIQHLTIMRMSGVKNETAH